MFSQICLKLQVELDQEEHGKGHSHTLKDHGPDVSKGRIQGLFAITTISLRDDRDSSEEDTNEAILEDADPDDLFRC